MLCTSPIGLGSSGKKVYNSSSGGAHFVKGGNVPNGGDGGLLAQPGPRHLFVATSSGATWIYVSNDGGRHWRISL